MSLFDALSQFQMTAVEEHFYEPVAQAYEDTLNAIDLEWAQKTVANVKKIATAFGNLPNTIKGNYGNYAFLIYNAPLDPNNPLAAFTDNNYISNSTTTYASVDARRIAEVAALNASPAPWGALLANTVDELVKRDPSITLTNYANEVCLPALIEVATADVADEEFAETVLSSWNAAIEAAPRQALGKRPTYTVIRGDTLESISRAIYGNPNQVNDLITTLRLSAPFLSPTYRDGCMYPGFRIALPNDSVSEGEAETYGATWAIEVNPGDPKGGGQQWDILADYGLTEVSGVMGLMTELQLRAVQPIGDWSDSEVADYGRHMPTGEKMTTRGGLRDDFSLSAALLADPRVLTASPITASSGYASGLVIENALVTPIPAIKTNGSAEAAGAGITPTPVALDFIWDSFFWDGASIWKPPPGFTWDSFSWDSGVAWS